MDLDFVADLAGKTALVLVVLWFIVLLFARMRYGSWRRFIEAMNVAERREQK